MGNLVRALAVTVFSILVPVMAGCGQTPAEPGSIASTVASPPPLNSLSGHVYDGNEETPFGEVLVKAEQWTALPPPPDPDNPGEPVPLLPVLHPVKAETRTATDGSYIMTGLPPGVYIVEVSAEGRESITQKVDVPDDAPAIQDFTFIRYSTITGHVYDAADGQPIAGIQIEVWPGFVSPRATATTRADGSYTVTGLPEGTWKLRAGGMGYVPKLYDGISGSYRDEEQAAITTRSGETTTDIDFELEQGGSIICRVFEDDGVTPATGVYIEYEHIDGPVTPGLWHSDLPSVTPFRMEAGADNTFRLTGKLAGTYRLRVIRPADNSVSEYEEISIAMGEDTLFDFIMER